jgi:hypothetical protein
VTRSLNAMTVRSSAISLGRGLILGGGTTEMPGLAPKQVQVRMGPIYKRVRLVRGRYTSTIKNPICWGGIGPIKIN